MVRGRLTTAVVECDISEKVDWMSRADCMASSVTRSVMDFLLWGHLKDQDIRRL
jgi:hypothetical protein